jgi:hypothetical protein
LSESSQLSTISIASPANASIIPEM